MATAKPVLRNLLLTKTKIDGIIAIAVGFGVALAYKYGVQHRRKQTIEDFYKTYDAKSDYRRMKNAKVFQSINRAVEKGIIR